jgi:hypothetical protein
MSRRSRAVHIKPGRHSALLGVSLSGLTARVAGLLTGKVRAVVADPCGITLSILTGLARPRMLPTMGLVSGGCACRASNRETKMVNFLVGPDLLALKSAYDIAANAERRALDKFIEASSSLSTPADKYALILAEKRLTAARQQKLNIYQQILGASGSA